MSAKEKRKTSRRRVSIPIICWEDGDERRLGSGKEIVSKNLSSDGVAFYSQLIYPIGQILCTDIFLPSRKAPLSCKLQIVSLETVVNKDEYIIGAAFLDLASEDRLAIASALEKMDLYLLLNSAVQGGASDLHLTVGRPPMARRDGKILPMAGETVEEGQVEAMVYPLLTKDQVRIFEQTKELDFAFSPDLNSRFRVNLHSQKGFIEATFRNIPTAVKSFEELFLPAQTLEEFCNAKSGLILIAGSTGSGKTTTMCSMIDYINKNQQRVVVAIEDPIEYTFKSHKSIIKQRELGTDTFSYAEALKRALRQDPDVICVGEILDADCLSAALRAAETGHLVISTVHAPDTVSAIERLVGFFPPEHAVSMSQQLSTALAGILLQVLLPRKDLGGRVLASELLVNRGPVKNLIRERRFSQMANVLQTGRAMGMYTFQSSVMELHSRGIISDDVLAEHSTQEYT